MIGNMYDGGVGALVEKGRYHLYLYPTEDTSTVLSSFRFHLLTYGHLFTQAIALPCSDNGFGNGKDCGAQTCV